MLYVFWLVCCVLPLLSLASFDVIVYGATPGGIQTALTAAKEGLGVLLVHPSARIGGMMTNGLGASDVGNISAIGGASLQFFLDICSFTTTASSSFLSSFDEKEQASPCWHFQPHAALELFEKMLNASSVTVLLETSVVSVNKIGTKIVSLQFAPTSFLEKEKGNDYLLTSQILNSYNSGSMFSLYNCTYAVDATYEGDLLAVANVSFALGREGRNEYNESLAGVMSEPSSLGSHQFLVPVDTRWSNGSLLPMISEGTPGEVGSGDTKVQAYNFRLCMTTNSSNLIPFPKPDNYDTNYWELARRWIKAANVTSFNHLANLVSVGGGKTDTNNNGPISTDYLAESEGSWEWAISSPSRRKQLWQNHYDYTTGFFWFLQHDEQVPASIRNEALTWGLARDEFVDTAGWPPQLYVREGRRMRGEYVFRQQDRQFNLTKPDSVGLFSYNIDSHNTQRYASSPNQPLNEGDFEKYGGPLGQIPYRVLTPLKTECTNLLAPVPLSATHMGYGTLRLEPQFMIIGQSCGIALAQALKYQQTVQNIDIPLLQSRLRQLDQRIDLF